MNILILGGYGNTGLRIAKLLLKHSDHHLVVAGRNINKADEAIRLFESPERERIKAKAVDTSNPNELKETMSDAGLVVVASSTTKDIKNVADAAIETDTHYIDTQLSFPYKLDYLKEVEQEIEKRALTFMTDGGFHPGVPAALIRFANKKLDSLQIARVGSLVKMDWASLKFSDNTMSEFLDEFRYYKPIHLEGGVQKKINFNKPRYFSFKAPFGKKQCTALWLDELDDLKNQIPDLQDCGFYIAGFNWFNDYLVMPLIFMALNMAPKKEHRLLAQLMTWGLRKFSKPPFGTELVLESQGKKDGTSLALDISLFHEDAYDLTAIPVVASLLQFFENPSGKPGLWFQAHYVEPEGFLLDMKKMGIEVEVQEYELSNK